jgi:hypothetical protein
MPIVALISLSSLYFVLGRRSSLMALMKSIGWASIAGVGCIVLLGPLSTVMGNAIVKYQEEQLKNTDVRVGIMNEVLQGIRIVKYFAWERYFTKKV